MSLYFILSVFKDYKILTKAWLGGDVWTEGQTDKWTNRQMDGCKDKIPLFKMAKAWLAAPEAWLAAPEAWLRAQEAWLRALEAWLRALGAWLKASEAWLAAPKA